MIERANGKCSEKQKERQTDDSVASRRDFPMKQQNNQGLTFGTCFTALKGLASCANGT
jgi:hypothetical protein